MLKLGVSREKALDHLQVDGISEGRSMAAIAPCMGGGSGDFITALAVNHRRTGHLGTPASSSFTCSKSRSALQLGFRLGHSTSR